MAAPSLAPSVQSPYLLTYLPYPTVNVSKRTYPKLQLERVALLHASPTAPVVVRVPLATARRGRRPPAAACCSPAREPPRPVFFFSVGGRARGRAVPGRRWRPVLPLGFQQLSSPTPGRTVWLTPRPPVRGCIGSGSSAQRPTQNRSCRRPHGWDAGAGRAKLNKSAHPAAVTPQVCVRCA